MSMWSGISQIKQTLTDELQQASGSRKPPADAISSIERNAKLLTAEPADVDDIISSLDDDDSVNSPSNSGQSEPVSSQDSSAEEKPKSESVIQENNASDPGSSITQNGNAENSQQIDVQKDSKDPEASDSPADLTSDLQESKETSANSPHSTAIDSQDGAKESPTNGGKSSNGETPASVSRPVSRTSSRANLPSEATSGTQSREASPHGDTVSLNAKLAKFAKYESMYPRLLKAYRDERKRGEMVKLYEKVLSENTPCSSIAEPRVLIDYLNDIKSKTSLQHTEIGRIGSELGAVKKQNESNKQELKLANQEVSRLKSELDSTVAKLQKIQEDKELSAKNAAMDSELKARIEFLESQLGVAEQARDAATKSVATLRSQLDELNVRLKETFAESESLRDELHDSERLAHERLEELTTAKNALRSREHGDRASARKTDSEVASLLAEKELLESEVELLNKRIIRESEQLQLQIKSLKTRLQESEAHEEDLRKQVISHSQSLARAKSQQPKPSLQETKAGQIQDRHSESAQSTTHDHQTSSSATSIELVEAREAAANAAKANELLKQVHKDNALRIEKLQKSQKALLADIEQLRHENSQLKRRPSISTVSSMDSQNDEERDKQQAYLKNVLLGFIQHKDQRKALLPVLATLLNLKDSETEQFLNGFA